MQSYNTLLLLNTLTSDRAISLLQSTHYYQSYRAILTLGSQVSDDFENDGLLGLTCAAYGWMPTIFKKWEFGNFGFENPIATVNGVSDLASAQAVLGEINTVSPINNSWVGLSKVLHFLNPEIFPIWDSRIAKNFGLENRSQFNKKERYIDYLIFVHENLNQRLDVLSAVADHIENSHNYRPSNVRCLELLMLEQVIE